MTTPVNPSGEERRIQIVLDAFDTLFNKRDYAGRALLVSALHPAQRTYSARP
jgi:hypothetical protein